MLENSRTGSSGQLHWASSAAKESGLKKQSSAPGIQETTNRLCTLNLNDRMFRPRSSSASNSAPSSIPAHVLHARLSNDIDSKSVDRSHGFRHRHITTPTIVAPDMWQDSIGSGGRIHDSGSSHIDRDAHSDNSITAVQRRRKAAVHRSRSDLTKRFSNSSEFSDLSSRFSRNSADLEKFFNDMGLDQNTLEPMLIRHGPHNSGSSLRLSSSELHLFESMSSLHSPDARSWCSDDSYQQHQNVGQCGSTGNVAIDPDTAGSTDALGGKGTQGGLLLGERNARVIKWLCSVKKATSQDGETEADEEALGDHHLGDCDTAEGTDNRTKSTGKAV